MELPLNDRGPWIQFLSKTLYELNSTRAPVENWQEVSLLNEDEFEFFRSCVNFLSLHGGASQNFQDAWAWFRYDDFSKRRGFFVEFGAFDGVYSSNTIRLQNMGWTGILAEPNPQWKETLIKNRAERGISIETEHCITGQSGQIVDFVIPNDSLFAGVGVEAGAGVNRISMPSLSLNDLLTKHDAPSRIEFMSVDTEGSEYEILRSFDFKKWNVQTLCVEHNFSPAREQIYKLMTANGYVREFEAFSRWDDFYRKVQ